MRAVESSAMRRGRWRTALPAALALSMVACGGDATGPRLPVQDVAGTYNMTVLTFDPQGVLAEEDILARLGIAPQLILNTSGAAQIVYRDPNTNLFITLAATFRTTADGVRLDFDSRSAYASLLFSRTMELRFTASPRSLLFDGDSPTGVSRTRLRELVPNWVNEQLLDPTPGRLRVRFSG